MKLFLGRLDNTTHDVLRDPFETKILPHALQGARKLGRPRRMTHVFQLPSDAKSFQLLTDAKGCSCYPLLPSTTR
jgi:hypothetical protein